VQKKIKIFLQRLSESKSFQHFSRQARGDTCGTGKKEVPIWKKSMWSTMEGVFLFIVFLIRKSPPREEHSLPSIVSLLPSVTKTEGEGEKAFCVAEDPT
jgi:hypothetical protein